MPVNGSLCNYDYVQPCAPGTGLNHRTLSCLQSRKNKVKHQKAETLHISLNLISSFEKNSIEEVKENMVDFGIVFGFEVTEQI